MSLWPAGESAGKGERPDDVRAVSAIPLGRGYKPLHTASNLMLQERTIWQVLWLCLYLVGIGRAVVAVAVKAGVWPGCGGSSPEEREGTKHVRPGT